MKEVRTASASGGEKGVKKQRYELIPPLPLMEVARLYGRGARKYAAHNFRRGYEWSKSFGALQRHVNLFWSGEDIDQEMGLHHLTAVAWHAIALTEFQAVHTLYDDRPTGQNRPDRDTVTLGHYEEPFQHIDLELAPATEDGSGLLSDRNPDDLEPRYDLIPARPLAELAEAYGLLRSVPQDIPWSSLYARIQEHAALFWAGEDRDKDGILHTVHVLRYSLELLKVSGRKELDDRLLQGAAPIGFDSQPA